MPGSATRQHSLHPTSVLEGNTSTAVLKTSSKNTNEIQTVVLWPPPTHRSLDHEAWTAEKNSEQVTGPSKSALLCMLATQKIYSGQRQTSRFSLVASVPACVGGGEDPAEQKLTKDTARHLLQPQLSGQKPARCRLELPLHPW